MPKEVGEAYGRALPHEGRVNAQRTLSHSAPRPLRPNNCCSTFSDATKSALRATSGTTATTSTTTASAAVAPAAPATALPTSAALQGDVSVVRADATAPKYAGPSELNGGCKGDGVASHAWNNRGMWARWWHLRRSACPLTHDVLATRLPPLPPTSSPSPARVRRAVLPDDELERLRRNYESVLTMYRVCLVAALTHHARESGPATSCARNPANTWSEVVGSQPNSSSTGCFMAVSHPSTNPALSTKLWRSEEIRCSHLTPTMAVA